MKTAFFLGFELKRLKDHGIKVRGEECDFLLGCYGYCPKMNSVIHLRKYIGFTSY